MPIKIKTVLWLAVFLTVLAWSAVDPRDRVTWWLEAGPAILALAVLAATRKTYPLTSLAYCLILAHAIVLMVGAHYTYAEVPVGDWFASISGSERNNYDKLGHFAQGFVPAMLAREILIRQRVVKSSGWLVFVVLCFCLALSALYELIEWWAALISAEGAEAFLGTQGYVWDTQSDMMWALTGAGIALLTLSVLHDRQLQRIMAARRG